MNAGRLGALALGSMIVVNLGVYTWLKIAHGMPDRAGITQPEWRGHISAGITIRPPIKTFRPTFVKENAAAPPPRAATEANASSIEKRIPSVSQLEVALADPAFRHILRERQNYVITLKYGVLINSFGLDADAELKFKTLLAEKQLAKSDATSAARQEGLKQSNAGEGYKQIVTKIQEPFDAQLKELLGADKFEAYQHYEASLPMRELAEQARLSLSYTPTPLTAAQVESVIDAMYYAQPDAKKDDFTGLNVEVGGGIRRATSFGARISDLTLKALAPLLQPEQLAAFRRLKEIQDLGTPYTQQADKTFHPR